MRVHVFQIIFSTALLFTPFLPFAKATTHKNNIVVFENNAVITGTLSAEKKCTQSSDKRNPTIWLSIGQTLLYQVEVPVNGNFEFHAIPGKYDLLVTSPSGCLGQATLSVEPGQVAKTNLLLEVNQARGGETK